MSKPRARLLYDGNCPICSRYRDYVALRREFEVEFVNARANGDLVREFRQRGYEIEDGMILELGGHVYQGSDAVATMQTLTQPRGYADRFVRYLVRHPPLLRIGYPIVKVLRKVQLKLLGRDTSIASEDHDHP